METPCYTESNKERDRFNQMKQPRVKGKFGSPYKEPRGEPIALRLEKSLDEAVREVAGSNLNDWVRSAIAEKLEREQQAPA
jgi:hypothetical protein